MDAFFVGVERLRDPSLAGKPVVVGGAGPRGVVAAASYEARVFGLRSAMPMSQALRRCPHAIVLAGDYQRYAEMSRRLFDHFTDLTPMVEPIALDEAFLDVSGATRLLGSERDIAGRLRERIAKQEGLQCSVGVGPSKLVAKLASEAAKPTVRDGRVSPGAGVTVIAASEVTAFLYPLPVRALWGVGAKTSERLARYGVRTVGDVAEMPLPLLRNCVGEALGRHLHQLANGIDDRPVEVEREAKSISHEETFPYDIFERERLEVGVTRMADAVALRLRRAELYAARVSVKVRYGSFRLITRTQSLVSPTRLTSTIEEAAQGLLASVDLAEGVRLLGVGVGLHSGPMATQLSLEAPEEAHQQREAVESAMDEIRGRFGDHAIGAATLLEGGKLRIKRRGDAQWGPDDG